MNTIAMRLISTPAWAKPFRRSIDPRFGEDEVQRVLLHHDAILMTVQEAVRKYVEDPALTFDTRAEGFPSRDRLSGEYYIAGESYLLQDEPWFQKIGRKPGCRFSVLVHCLETCPGGNSEDRDYLGLEIHFAWLPETGAFAYLGDIDSSSI
ncbi:MAG: hypothetical protein LBF93_02660 [Zoogloeaceae bacterium]|jgi:hypothetical protein|nr:hypothetical protein [Zoogloeaceae bacterium]